jgi:O-antigen/teichoic acid export membrane protein
LEGSSGAPPVETDSIARNTTFALATQLARAAVTAVVTLYLVRKLGPSGYGVFALAVGIGALVVLASDFGLTQATERFIAERSGDAAAVRSLLAEALRLKLIGGVALAAGLFALAGPIADAYGNDALAWPLRAVAVSALGQTMLFLYRGAFVALGRVSVNFRIVTLESAAEAAATIAIVAAGGGAAGAAWGRASGYVLGALIGALAAARIVGGPRSSARAAGVTRRSQIVRYAGALFIVNATYVLFEQIDVLLIGAIVSTSAVGFFEAPLRLAIFLSYAGQAVAFGVAPRLARSSGGRPDVHAFETALRYLLLIQSALLAPVLVWAEPIVHALFGNRYGDSIGVLRALAPFIFMSAIGTFVTLSVNYLGEARRRVPLAICAVALNAAIDAVLLPSIGVIGGAVGTDVAFAVYVLGHLWICSSLLRFELRPLISTLIRSLAAAAVAAAVLAAFGTSGISALDALIAAPAAIAAYALTLLATRELSVHELAAAARALSAR